MVRFLFTDGCVENKYFIKMGLSIKDKEHLEGLKIFSNSNDKLSICHGKYDSCRFNLYGKKLVSYLSQYGLIRRKTFKGKPNNIPNNMFQYWILGYFDGDGSIFKTKRGDYVVSIVGNEFTLNLIKIWVNENYSINLNVKKHKSIFEFRLGELDSFCLLFNLYKNSPKVYLERKHKLFMEVKNKVENRFKSLINIYKKDK